MTSASRVDGSIGLHVNYLYVLEHIARVNAANPRARILDYGCGGGEVVCEARRRNFDAWGVDVFYGGSDAKRVVEQLGVLGTYVSPIVGGRIPHPDGAFDLVVCNQVFEHVESLAAVLDEIRRVLKPGGRLLALFPARDVIREGHIGIPFVHWMRKGSRARYLLTLVARRLGMGYFKAHLTPKEWTTEQLAWIDAYTFYRPRGEILREFTARFSLDFLEVDYIRFRLVRTDRGAAWSRLLALPGARGVASAVFRRLAGLVLLADKPNGCA